MADDRKSLENSKSTTERPPVNFRFQLVSSLELVSRRISKSALENYLCALEIAVANYLAEQELETCVILVNVLLSANNPNVLEVQLHRTDNSTRHWTSGIAEVVGEVSSPVVESGSIIFWMMGMVKDGEKLVSENMCRFAPMFSTLKKSLAPNPLDLAYSNGEATPEIEQERFYECTNCHEPGILDGLIRMFFETKPMNEFRPKPNPNVDVDFSLLQLTKNTLAEWDQAVGEQKYPGLASYGRGWFHYESGNFSQAVEDFTITIQKWPQDARPLYARSRAHAPDSIEQALKDVESALSMSPGYANASVWRVKLLLELNAKAAAEAELEKCISLRPVVPEHHLFKAWMLMDEQRHEEAYQLLEELEAFDPHEPELLVLAGHLTRLNGKSDELEGLIEDIKTARQHSPYSFRLQYELMQCLNVQERFEELIQEADPYTEFSPEIVEIHRLLVHSHQELGNTELVIKNANRGLEFHPECPVLQSLKAHGLLIKGQKDEATSILEDVLERHSDMHQALWLMARVKMDLSEYDEALEIFSQCNRMLPDPNTEHMVAICLTNLGRFQEAEKAISTCVEQLPEVIAFRHLRAWVLLELKQSNAALEQINEAIQREPHEPGLRYLKARILTSLTNTDQAVNELDRAIELAPDFAEAIELRACLHANKKDFTLAERDFNKLVEKFPMSGYPLSLRARFWQQAGQHFKAERDLEGAIKREPQAAQHLQFQQQFSKAQGYFDSEDYIEAIASCDRMEEQYGNSLSISHLRATAHWYEGSLVEAVDELTKCLDQIREQADGSPNAYWFGLLSSRGQVYAEMGEYGQALSDLNQVIEAENVHADPIVKAYASSGRGVAMTGLQRYEEAEADFRFAANTTPDNAWLHFNQALFHFQLKEPERARICLELALECNNPKLTKRMRRKAKGFNDSLAGE